MEERIYETIIVAVDMSETSNRAVRAAGDLARLSGGKVVLLHVKERELIPGRGGGLYDLEEPEDTENLFAEDNAVLHELGVPVTASLRRAIYGHAAEEILDAASQHGAGIIVMGSRGRSAVAHFLLGSIAYKVVHLADRPALIVR